MLLLSLFLLVVGFILGGIFILLCVGIFDNLLVIFPTTSHTLGGVVPAVAGEGLSGTQRISYSRG